MALNFTGANLLSQNRESLYFGDIFRYAIRDSYSVNGFLTELSNASGVSGILTQISGQSKESIDYQIIVLNGSYFGLGKINSLTHTPGNDVRLKPYTCNFEIINSGNIFNLPSSDPLYSGVNISNSNYPLHLINNFSEEFNTNISDDGSYTETQNIRLQFNSGGAIGTVQSPISMAQQFAANLINSNPNVGFIDSTYSGWRRQPGRRRRQESINLITNEISITETFKLLKGISGSYSINYVNALSVNENGITQVSERGRVQGLSPDAQNQYYASAYSGMLYEVNNFSYLRCNNLFNSFQLGAAYPLSSRRTRLGQSLNKFSDTVDYDVTFTNDPKINESYSWEYTQNIDRDSDACTYSVSENGSIVGLSTDCSPGSRYSNALTAYSGVKTGIYNRTYSFYTGFSNFANPLKLIGQSENKSTFAGTIQYSFNYSDNLLYSTSGVKKITIDVTDDHAVPGVNLFDIPNVKQIAQPNNIMTLSKRSLSLDIVGLRGTQLTGYLSTAINQINSYIPTGTDCYISNLGPYSFNPLKNNFSINTEWTYQENIDLTQFILS